MSNQTTISAADVYAHIKSAFIADPGIEAALLKDFEGTVAERFGVDLPAPGKLVRNGAGFRLTYDGKDYDLADPRTAASGELNDAELELVAGGGTAPGCESKGTFGIAKPGWMKPNYD